MKDESKNFMLFAVIAALILFGFPLIQNRFFPTANPPATKIVAGKQVVLPKPRRGSDRRRPRRDPRPQAVLAESPRIRIQTPTLQGSINLKGARIDDLVLTQYKETIAKDSAPIRLLSPAGAPDAYFAGFGWRDDGLAPPAADAVWTRPRRCSRPAGP